MEILIYAFIAAFFAWRLYTTLGTRHGDERPRPTAFSGPEQKNQKDMMALPLELPAPKTKDTPLLAAPAPAPQSLSGALYAIQQADPSFDERSFVKGAKLAFEMIVHAYAASEREALRNLVSPVLFEAFVNAIDAREKANERVEITLLNVTEAHVTMAELRGKFVYITVEFTSDQARTTTQNNVVKEAEPAHRLHDLWTFRRELGATDPNWVLVETRTA